VIILQSQISDIDLDTLTLELTLKFIQTPFVNLDTLTLSMSLPTSPSLGLIQLDTLTLALSPTVIPPGSPIVVALSSVVMDFVVKTIGFIQETGYAMKDLLSVLQQGGKAPVTPARFVDCDLMNIVDAFRAGTTQPKIPEDETCMMSDLLNALDIGNPIPFEVPIIGTWFGEQECPDYIPSVRNTLLSFNGTPPFNILISADKGYNWTAHPQPTINTSPPCSGYSITAIKYLGNGVILIALNSSEVSILYRGTEYGLKWQRLDLSEYYLDTLSVSVIASRNGKVFVSCGDCSWQSSPPTYLLRSTNVGASWTQQVFPDDTAIVSIDFIDDNTILMYRYVGTAPSRRISKSIDGGVTWVDKWTGTNTNVSNSKIRYLGNGHCIVVVTDYYSPNIDRVLLSSDYGETWTDHICGGSGSNAIQAPTTIVVSLGNGVVIAGVTYRGIFRSVDYGATWTRIYASDTIVLDIKDLGGGFVLATIYGYYDTMWLVHSSNYGATWTLGERVAKGVIEFIPE